jgi:hypothetical protein
MLEPTNSAPSGPTGRADQRKPRMADAAFDIIIGSGPDGRVTAIRASQLGFKTALADLIESPVLMVV